MYRLCRTPGWLLSIAAALLIGVNGCSSKRACSTMDDCMVDEICESRVCVAVRSCTDTDDCMQDEACRSGRCVTERRCSTAADCKAMQVCSQGLCTTPGADAGPSDAGSPDAQGVDAPNNDTTNREAPAGSDQSHDAPKVCKAQNTRRERWRVSVSRSPTHWPAVGSDGTVYVVGKRELVAVADGNVEWRFALQNGDQFTLNSSPAVGSDGVYIGDDKGHIYKVGFDGKQRWKLLIGSAKREVFSPLVAPNGNIYVGAENRLLRAISPQGRIIWTYDSVPGAGSSTVDDYNRPAVGTDGTIYAPTSNNLHAVTAAGRKLWQFKGGGTVLSPPVVGQGGTIYFSSYDSLYGVRRSGQKLFELEFSSYTTPPILGRDGSLYIVSGSRLHKIAPNGSPVWNRALPGSKVEMLAPLFGPRGNIYVPSTKEVTAWSPEGNLMASLAIASGPRGVVMDVARKTLIVVQGATAKSDVVAYRLDVVCDPCKLSCRGADAVQCREDGSGFRVVKPCRSPFRCSNGSCELVCPPNVKGCRGSSTAVQCSPDGGEWRTVEECTGGKVCKSGACVRPPCKLSCSASSGGISVGLSCGSSKRTCNYGRDTSGRVTSIRCSYDNGRSFSCRIRYNGLGQASGSCSGEGDTCSF